MCHLFDRSARAVIFIYSSDWKTQLGRRCWDLASCQISLKSRSAVSEEKSKISQPIMGHGGHLCFPIGPKNTDLVKDVEILLPVKFRWIPFSDFREEVENVSANQRPGRLSCFSDKPEKHKLGRGRSSLHPVKFRWIPFSGFREEVEKVKVYGRTDVDGRRTDGRRTVRYDNSSLEPSVQVS